jgi:predicted nucleotidyltransferase
MQQKEALEAIKRIVIKHLRDTGARVYLFGSWVRGEQQHSSDIDVGVWYEYPLPSGTLSYLREALEESTIPYTVDLVDLTRTNSDFRESVFKEGKLWNA